MSVTTGRAQQVAGTGVTPNTDSANDLLRQAIADDAKALVENGGVPRQGQGTTATAKRPDASSRGAAMARRDAEHDSRGKSVPEPTVEKPKQQDTPKEPDTKTQTEEDGEYIRVKRDEYNGLKATAGRAQAAQAELAQVKRGLRDTGEMADFLGTANKEVRKIVDDTVNQLVQYARQNGTVDPLDLLDFVKKNIDYDVISDKAATEAKQRRVTRDQQEQEQERLSSAETQRIENLVTGRTKDVTDIHDNVTRELRDRGLDFGRRVTAAEAKEFITAAYEHPMTKYELEQLRDVSLNERDFQRYLKSAFTRIQTHAQELLETKIADEENAASANGRPATVNRPKVHGNAGSNAGIRQAANAGSGKYSHEEMNKMSPRDLLAAGFEDDGIYTNS